MIIKMKISRKLALYLLSIQHYNPDVEYPFYIMNKEYGDDDDFVGLEWDDYDTILEDENYKTFELRENESIYLPNNK